MFTMLAIDAFGTRQGISVASARRKFAFCMPRAAVVQKAVLFRRKIAVRKKSARARACRLNDTLFAFPTEESLRASPDAPDQHHAKLLAKSARHGQSRRM